MCRYSWLQECTPGCRSVLLVAGVYSWLERKEDWFGAQNVTFGAHVPECQCVVTRPQRTALYKHEEGTWRERQGRERQGFTKKAGSGADHSKTIMANRGNLISS